MKRLLLAGIILISLAMAMSPLTAAYSSSQRDTVAVSGGHMEASVYYNGNPKNYDNNITLGWPIGDFDHTQTKICFHFLGPVHMTGGFWNNRVFGAHNYTNGQWANETITIAISNGFDVTRTYSHINATMNNTNWEMTIYYYLSNVADMNTLITYTETDKTDPNVGKFWPVNDTLTFSALVPFDVDLYVKLSYPSTVVGIPDYFPWNGTTVGAADTIWTEYQKYGPAHGLDENDVEGAAGTVTATFDSNDKLDDATWDIKFSDAEWQGFFAGATSPVTVKIDGEPLDAKNVELTSTGLALKGMNIHNDKDIPVVFTWTTGTTTPTPPAATPDIFTQEAVAGVPNWALMGIALILVIAGVAIYKNEKK